MDIHIERKRTADKAGDFICTSSDKLFVLIVDPPERYPYLLLCLDTFSIVQNYSSIPSREELEEDIGENIKEIYNQEHATISFL